MAQYATNCELCTTIGGETLWSNPLCRVVLVDDRDYPGFCRVILNRHVAEMSDLDADEQLALMRIVFAVESMLRQQLDPDKINLASLGNMTPHVHWHVIPRWCEDRCFPNPIWGVALRQGNPPPLQVAPEKLRQVLLELLGDDEASGAEGGQR